jgi:hypothetical protein
MNSLLARNACLVLIAALLWHVFSGIYSYEEPINYSYRIKTILGLEAKNRPANADEIEKVLRSGHLLSTKPGKEGRKLTIEELENLASTGMLPKQ